MQGTVHENLDPWGEINEQIIWNTLKELQLDEFVKNLPRGLSTHISESNNLFSVG